jgi:signal transduction histidine kinase/YHS domain-containing protein
MKRLYVLSFVLLAGYIWVYRRLMLPLRQLASRAKQLSSGDFTALEQKYGGVPEIDTIRGAMNAMVGHVRRAQAQERTYIEALTNGQEAERARIARELHDDTVQSLIAIAQSLEIAQGFLEADTPANAMLKTARGQAIQTVDNLRRLIANLRPPILAELGLLPALQVLSEGTTATEVSIESSGNVRRLDETKELVLFRVAQEAVWNAIRHGQAQHISIHVMFHADHIHILIRDNGLGFEVPDCLDNLSADGHYGLVGMSERIQILEGTFEINSQVGKRTWIEISIPLVENLQPSDVVRDPVCSALIQPQTAYSSLEYQGQRFYFCCPVCEGAFQTNPDVYLQGHSRHHHHHH